MQIYSVVNVDKLKLHELPMIMNEDESAQVPSIHDFAAECMTKLQEDIILDRKVCTSRRGNVEYLHVGLKGMNTSKSRWMEIERVRKLYPHLVST